MLLDDPDPWRHHVIGVRVSYARNIAGHRLSPCMTAVERQKVQTAVSKQNSPPLFSRIESGTSTHLVTVQ